MEINPHTTISELLEWYPSAIRVFLEKRMRCIGCPAEAFHTLADAARYHAISKMELLNALQASINARKNLGKHMNNNNGGMSMHRRQIQEDIHWLGAVDWDRRLFDSLIPLPDGTTYNAYLIRGSEKTALLDTVDPPMADELMDQLSDVDRIDYIVSHHAEQDHSGAIPVVLERFPDAKVIVTPKAKGMLMDILDIPETAFITVVDGETLSLGNKTLKFIHTPWVHWPETMVTFLEKDAR